MADIFGYADNASIMIDMEGIMVLVKTAGKCLHNIITLRIEKSDRICTYGLSCILLLNRVQLNHANGER